MTDATGRIRSHVVSHLDPARARTLLATIVAHYTAEAGLMAETFDEYLADVAGQEYDEGEVEGPVTEDWIAPQEPNWPALVEDVRAHGTSVEIRGVKISRCDEYGRTDDVAEKFGRVVAALADALR